MMMGKGFTIVEVLVAAVIFGIAALGVYMAIAGIQKPVAKSNRSLVAAYFGQRVLDNLRSEVDARKWDDTSSGLYPTAVGQPKVISDQIGGVIYNAVYDVQEDSVSKARKVTMNIVWDDPS